MKPKLTIPNWVFDCLNKYGNCALPNTCVEMDRDELKHFLELKTKHKINLVESKYPIFDKNQHIIGEKPCLIAEEI